VFLYFQLLSLSTRAILICVANITFPADSIIYVLHLWHWYNLQMSKICCPLAYSTNVPQSCVCRKLNTD
jgi:hypothetical protein